MKKRNTVIRISLSVISIALVAVGTMVLRIPNPMGGYFNLGDVMIFVCNFIIYVIYYCI